MTVPFEVHVDKINCEWDDKEMSRNKKLFVTTTPK